MIKPTPKTIKRLENDGIEITWVDGSQVKLSARLLRENCPSAVSLAKRGDTAHDRPLSPRKASLKVISATIDEELQLVEIWSVGNYALGMRWGDGHDSGIYTFDYLYLLSTSKTDSD